jgi:ATP-dependent Clp protease adaptor protein ClpS
MGVVSAHPPDTTAPPRSGTFAASAPAPAPSEVERTDPSEAPFEVPEPDVPWVTLVHNDPVNLMSYVTYVFQTYFGYSKGKATKLMKDVHYKGRAVVSSGTREEMERDVQAMHGYGLWATLSQDR